MVTRRQDLTDADLEAMRRMREDGVPTTWIAETVDCNRHVVTSLTTENPEETRAWREEWKRITMRPELYSLHLEFAPSEVRL